MDIDHWTIAVPTRPGSCPAIRAIDSRIQVQQNTVFLPAVANHNRARARSRGIASIVRFFLGMTGYFPSVLHGWYRSQSVTLRWAIIGAYALEGQCVNWTGLPYATPVLSGRDICRKHLLECIYVFGTPTTVLYRSDLVRGRHAFYNEADIHADTEVCFELLKKCDFGFVHQVLAFTREREGSVSTRAADIHAYFGSMLYILTTHGKEYLTATELEQSLNAHLSAYYKFLGKNMLLQSRKAILGIPQAKFDAGRSRLQRASAGAGLSQNSMRGDS